MSDILNFISTRFPDGSMWLAGNCYYFALILADRFKGDIYYHVVDGHFVTRIDDVFYDHSGATEYRDSNYLIRWKDFPSYDELQYERIIRDCLQ